MRKPLVQARVALPEIHAPRRKCLGLAVTLLAALWSQAASAQANIDFGQASVTCHSAAECSPSVAMLLIQSASASGTINGCAGTLVGDDLLLTNAHCLDQQADLMRPGASCRGRIRAYFPASAAYPAEYADCREVLQVHPPHVSPGTGLGPNVNTRDFALVRLVSRLARPPLSLKRTGAQFGADVTVYYVDYVDDAADYIAVMRSMTCRAMVGDLGGSFVVPGYTSRDYPVVAFAGCPAVPQGASGSPAVQFGGLVALVQGYYRVRTPGGLALVVPQILTRAGFASPSTVDANIATNASCMDFDSDGATAAQLPSACVTTDQSMASSLVADRESMARAAVEHQRVAVANARSLLRAWASSDGAAARWRILERHQTGRVRLTLSPQCRFVGRRETPRALAVPSVVVRSAIDLWCVASVTKELEPPRERQMRSLRHC